jgi:hypothetical protein
MSLAASESLLIRSSLYEADRINPLPPDSATFTALPTISVVESDGKVDGVTFPMLDTWDAGVAAGLGLFLLLL